MKNKLPTIYVILVLFSFLTINQHIYSQNYNIDSLEILFEKASAKEKVNYYYDLTDYYVDYSPNKAIKFANEFLIFAEENDSTAIIEYCYKRLGEAYYLQEQYENSLNYFKKYLGTQVQKENRKNIAKAYNNLGVVYRAMDDYSKAIEYYDKSLQIKTDLKDTLGISHSYNNLGVLHESLKLFDLAKEYYIKSLNLESQLNNLKGISTSYLNIGGINLKLKNYNSAIEYCNRSIKICDSLDLQHTNELNYDILYQTYKELGNTAKSFYYLEKYTTLKNNRVNEETSSRIAELEMKYKSDNKQHEINILNREKAQKHTLNIILLIGILLLGIQGIVLFIYNRFRRKNNNILRGRNKEILLQNEEIQAQSDEIEAQRDEIIRQKEITDIQNDQRKKQTKDITDSIEYAKHIQIALFPDKVTLQKTLKQGFCLYKPKDIVSGDFYWVAQVENKSVIVCADCTGHGVPGAFMSIIGINFLNEIVYNENILKPNEILNQLRKRIIKTMIQAKRIEESKDGMDISLIVIDNDEMMLEYAGAYNHLYFIRDHMLNSIKADRMPIGISDKAIASFTNHTMKIKTGDLFYMFTDGYVDQFGGSLRKKYRIGNLRELLLDIHEKEMPEQKRILHETFINWKGQQLQVDDVLAIGIKI